MADATVLLGRDGMGEGASLADFNAWVEYVAARIDGHAGLDLMVASMPRREVQETRIMPNGTDVDRQAIRDALDRLWEDFCADDGEWAERADLDAVDAAAEASARAITLDHPNEDCDADPWTYSPDPADDLGDECRDPRGGLLPEVRARFATAFAAVINEHNAALDEDEAPAGEGG